MTRKLQKVIMKEGQRRSPRISAMEAWQTHGSGSGSKKPGDPVQSKGKNVKNCIHKRKKQHLDNDQGPAFRTRGKKKKKLRPVEEINASSFVLSRDKQGGKQTDDEDIQKKSDQPSNLRAVTNMPEKRILELVLNVLQRRDTYEIFAEPVDPKEVEDYYEIIEEPMDFGTMRAKLHEGMYKNLEKFEHDVFLIFNNAMHFNSSGTIYFRQARTINELAKKVFTVLKTDPENFESEFSETRQRNSRRNQGDFKDSANVKCSESTTSGMSSKIMPCPSSTTQNRKSLKSNQGRENSKQVDGADLKDPMGAKDNGRKKYFEVDKRCTYRPTVSIGENESKFPTVYDKLNLLQHVNQQDLGYKESLMLFSKGLGKVAQDVARRKLFGCQIHTASASFPWRPITLNTDTNLTSQNSLNRLPSHPLNKPRSPKGETAYGKVEQTTFGIGNAHNQGNQRMSLDCNQVYKDKSLWSNLYSADKSNRSIDELKGTINKSTTMLSEKSKSSNQEQLSESLSGFEHSQFVSRSRLETKYEFGSLSRDISSFMQEKSLMMQKPDDAKILQQDQTVPVASSFIFNLPFLKTRLDQINSSEQFRLSQTDSVGSGKRPCSA